MLGRRYALALLAVIALTVGACTATQTGGSPQASAQAPTPAAATPEPSPTAEETEEPTASASDDAGAGDYPLEAAESADVGPYLTGEGGMTLYYFTNDTQNAGNSVCNGDCATAWPPYVIEGDDEATPGDGVDGEIKMITRDDGSRQVAYNGWPLYYYAPDNAPGDTTGHEVGGVWFVLEP